MSLKLPYRARTALEVRNRSSLAIPSSEEQSELPSESSPESSSSPLSGAFSLSELPPDLRQRGEGLALAIDPGRAGEMPFGCRSTACDAGRAWLGAFGPDAPLRSCAVRIDPALKSCDLIILWPHVRM